MVRTHSLSHLLPHARSTGSSAATRVVIALVVGATALAVLADDARADAGSSAERLAQRRRGRRRRTNAPTDTAPPPTDTETPPTGNEAPPPVEPVAVVEPQPVAPPVERPVALDVHLAFRGIGRNLSYTNDSTSSFRGYDLGFFPSIFAAVEWFPGAHFVTNALAHIGLYGDFGAAFGMVSVDAAGNRFGSSAMLYDVGLRGRLPLGALDLGLRIGYGAQTFAIDNRGTPPPPDPNIPGVPGVAYQFLRIGVSARYDIAHRVGILVGLNYLLTLSAGEFSGREFFPHDAIHGLDGGLAVAVRVIAGLEFRVGFDARVFMHSLNAQATDPWNVQGATDLHYGLTIGAAYRL